MNERMTDVQRLIILHLQHRSRLFQRYSKSFSPLFVKRFYLLSEKGEVKIPMRVFHQLHHKGLIRSGREKKGLGKEFLLTALGKRVRLGGSPPKEKKPVNIPKNDESIRTSTITVNNIKTREVVYPTSNVLKDCGSVIPERFSTISGPIIGSILPEEFGSITEPHESEKTERKVE